MSIDDYKTIDESTCLLLWTFYWVYLQSVLQDVDLTLSRHIFQQVLC